LLIHGASRAQRAGIKVALIHEKGK
jgi:hypothetical protein